MKNRKLLHTGLCAAMLLCITFSGCGKDTEEQEAFRQEGIQDIHEGRYQEAIEVFDKALADADGSYSKLEIDICLYKAKAEIMLGKSDQAMNTYTRMIDYEKDSSAYFARGCLQLEEGDKDGALSDFESAVREDQDNYDLYIGISQVLDRHNLKALEADYLDKALKIDQDTDQASMQKGRIYMLKGDYEKAQKKLQKAIDQGIVEANYYMGQLWSVQGDKDLSEVYYKAYIDSGEAGPDELYELGRKQLDSGEYNGALQYFEAADKLEQAVTDVQSLKKNMIICYENLKDFKTAKQLMEEYVKAYPDDEKAQRELLFLETR